MRTFLMILFSLFLGLALTSCDDDNSFNVIDIGDGEEEPDEEGGDEETGSVYSITFSLESGGEFTFSVDMEGATIEGEDLPDGFEGDIIEFDPEVHEVFVAGNFGGDNEWNQPGTNSSLRLTTSGASGPTTTEGSHEYKYFILPADVTNEDGENASWDYGEWRAGANRSVEIAADGTVENVWGNQPEEEEDPGDGEQITELFMIGNALNMEDSDEDGTPDGWQWDLTDAPMVPVHSKPDLFWKIVWLNEGGEFKFAPQKEWSGDFGSDGNEAVDEIFEFGGDNLAVPGETGYYMVVVNLETEQIAVTAPQVYLIGDTIGSWDQAVEDALFDVDNENELITITRELVAAELRMYAWFDKGWFTDWWQSEFMIFDGEIEFRGAGDDQERVNIESDGDYTIDLNFSTGEGSIESAN